MCTDFQQEIASNNEDIGKIVFGYGEKLVRVTQFRRYRFFFHIHLETAIDVNRILMKSGKLKQGHTHT